MQRLNLCRDFATPRTSHNLPGKLLAREPGAQEEGENLEGQRRKRRGGFVPSSFFPLPSSDGLTSVTSRTLLVAELPFSDGLTSVTSRTLLVAELPSSFDSIR
ncbi:hypothetical protein QT970_12280 [Microcoleus sp. herbarium8]|uniref:hypothetical protein n=1 Tax=Microcoleus sp. herbarium8 TaxID=3055436 RepID=UPI002FD73D08